MNTVYVSGEPAVNTVYVVDAVRTPIGRYDGSLACVRPDDLTAHVIRELLCRTPELEEEGLKATGREPLARISATAVSAHDPDCFDLAPVEAVDRALPKAGRDSAICRCGS